MDSGTLAILVLLAVGTIAGLIVYILTPPGTLPLPMPDEALNEDRISSQWAGGLHLGGPLS